MTEKIQCLIIGSGPAGYTAAIYTSRANLHPVVYTGIQRGGQLTITTEIDNFPGHPNGIQGPKLMEDMELQAARFGADIRQGIVEKVDFSSRPFKAWADDGKEIIADAVIIATGASARYLGLESEERFKGMGVSACATCDGFFYRNQIVAVAGGGDTACEEAVYLAGIAKKVYLIHRRDELRASKAMQERVFKTPNIEILWSRTTDEIVGDDDGVTGIILNNLKTNQKEKYDISGFFVAIGHHPNTEVFKDFIECDKEGYIITKPGTTQTNIPGIFAAGDVQDTRFKQAITAAGTGCMAAIELEKFLKQ